MKKGSLLEFAGRWKMSDEETKKFKKDIKKRMEKLEKIY